MPSTVVGRLRTDLICNTSQYEVGMRKASASTSGFAANVKTAGTSLKLFALKAAGLAGITVSIGGVAALVKSQLAAVAELGKTAQQIGIGAQAFIQLQAAAKATGSDVDSLASVLVSMQRNIGAASTGAGDGAKAFAELGLSANRLKALSVDKQFLLIRDALSRVPNAADRARLAVATLGKSASAIMPMLRADSGTIGRAMGAANAPTDDQVRQAMLANAALNRVSESGKMLARTFAIELAPSIVQTADAMSSLKDEFATAGKMASAFWTGMNMGVTVLNAALADTISMMARIVGASGTAEYWNNISKSLSDSAKQMGQKWLKDQLPQPVAKNPAAGLSIQEQVGERFGAIRERLDREIEDAMKALRQRVAGVYAGTLTPYEQMMAKVADFERLRNAGAISEDTFSRAKAAATKDFESGFKATPREFDWSGGAARGSAEAYSAIVNALKGDIKQDQALRVQKQQLVEAQKSARSLAEIEKGLKGDEIVGLDSL